MKAILLALILGQVPLPGQRMEPFTLQTPQGAPVSWKPGRATVVTFVAFWCDTWKEQLSRASQAQRRLKGLPVDFITVSVDARWAELAAAKPPGTFLLDPGSRLTRQLGIDRIPYTLAVAPNGRISLARFGVLRSEDILAALRPDPSVDRVCHLTFDDFPAPRGNDELLDVLRREGVQATFFCIGSNIQGREPVMRRALLEGHSLQMHSWGHAAGAPELERNRQALARLGAAPSLYRPPGSSRILRAREALPNPVIDPYDYLRPGTNELQRRILLNLRPNGVIQLHAGVEETRTALADIIAAIRERGYRIEPLL